MKTVGDMEKITLKVNGVEYSVHNVKAETTLVEYLREKLELRGTKSMCLEGSCGICCVSVIKTPGGPVESVNACMVAVMSCQDWDITTVEGIGNRQKGYHVVQTTLAEHNGSQCGYCSPGWVANMYSLLQKGAPLTMMEIEKSFGSNICRCTGYRSILEAFRRFAIDAHPESRIMDIEDLHICKKTGLSCDKKSCDDDDKDWCMVSDADVKKTIKIQLAEDKFWYRVTDMNSIFEIWRTHGTEFSMLVSGNTVRGVVPVDEFPKVMIDIARVQELKGFVMDQNLNLGAGNTLTECIEICQSQSRQEFFGYLEKIVKHIELIASVPIRNLGSIGGNLMLKHRSNGTPSDIFLLLETVGAYLTIVSAPGDTKTVSMQEFLREDMQGKIIHRVLLPPLTDQYKIVTYKMMPRSQAVRPIVNAGMLFRLGSNNNVIEARLVYGAISTNFIRAEATENFLVGKILFSNTTIQGALSILQNELEVLHDPLAFSVEYKKELALSLFYKACLSLCPSNILNPRYISGATNIHDTRPVSQSKQTFDTDRSLWPLNEPIPKIEGLIQCAGETVYTDDMPTQPGEVHAAFVLSEAVGDIVQIDASAALRLPGVITFLSAADIPGENTFTPGGTPFFEANEEVFASTKSNYFEQPIGIIVAESHHLATVAAKLVTATYANVREPVLDIKVAKEDQSRNRVFLAKPATDRGADVVTTIKGHNTIFGQMHIPTESMSCITRTTEEGIECHVTTQWMDGVQYVLSKALNIDANKIDVHVRRLGGAFGLKISRSSLIAVACALATQVTNRTCRFKVPLNINCKAIGKRASCHTDFEVDVNAQGLIQSVNYRQYDDNGFMYDEMLTYLGADVFNNCYTEDRWDYAVYDTITDIAKTTWCRSPGTLESIALAEYLIERIAYTLNIDPIKLRKINLDPKYKDISDMADELMKTANYNERRENVDSFNRLNRWKKRGLRSTFLRWTPVGSPVFDVNLSVYHVDGTVIITHGGIEMGQGINTKAVQICAHMLNIPIDKIQIKANNTIVAPNCFVTGGSVGTQNTAIGVRKCCEQLLARLEPIRTQLGNPTWLELIHRAFTDDVDLQAHGYSGAGDVQSYDVYGVCIVEAEVDILTGESEILRVDIIQDVGQCVSPLIDMGQIEGAFVMGQGYWTCENMVTDKATGRVLTDRLWHYWMPGCRDIPQDMRVTLNSKFKTSGAIFGAKGTGEPSICMSVCVGFAIREAITAGRKDAGHSTSTWYDIDGSYTVDKIRQASAISTSDFLYT